jgi:predicted transcriptional regulator
MTTFNLEENPGVWFDMEGGGRVQICTMTADAMKAIRKVAVKKHVEYKRIEGKAERFEVEDVNEDLHSELFWDHVLVGWENLCDAKGNAIPCTTEAKILLLSKSVKFAAFVGECLKTLNESEAQEAEANAKNS